MKLIRGDGLALVRLDDGLDDCGALAGRRCRFEPARSKL
jgi:hypothetical protein